MQIPFEYFFLWTYTHKTQDKIVWQGQSLKSFAGLRPLHFFQPHIVPFLFWTPNFRTDINLITDSKYKNQETRMNQIKQGITWELYKTQACVVLFHWWKDLINYLGQAIK